jgi:hypothetical protein
VKVLFFMRHPGYVRNFESMLRELVARGHQLHIAFDTEKTSWTAGRNPVETLCGDLERLTYSTAPRRPKDRRARFAREVRGGLDFLRYLGPEYEHAPKLRERAVRKAPQLMRSITQRRLGRSRLARALLRKALLSLDRSLGQPAMIQEFIASERPDVVLVTPLVGFGSEQVEYVRAARCLRIPSVLCVASWDNLTNKGLIRDAPDFVVVWNEMQRDEAIRLHGIEPERVIATGAHTYDHWFRWVPSTDRQTFCAKVGLDPAHPILLYLCSSPFIAPEETSFVRRWIARVRTSSSEIASAGVLVRPHPQNAAQWERVQLDDLRNAVVWPQTGADPVDVRSKADLFDSIFHSCAVVGVNTSALIESAIVGRDVYTILDEEFAATQEGTLHFAHLTNSSAPLLHTANDLDQHVDQLRAAFAEEEAVGEARRRAFLHNFVRPFGLEEPGAPRIAAVVEEAAATEPRPASRSLGALLLAPITRAVTRPRSGSHGQARASESKRAVGAGSSTGEEAR